MPFTLFILKGPVTFLAIVILYFGQSQLPAYVTFLAMNIITLFLDVSGLVYPLLLLFLNHYVRNDWKAMAVLWGRTAFNWLRFISCKCCRTPETTHAQETAHAHQTLQETDL